MTQRRTFLQWTGSLLLAFGALRRGRPIHASTLREGLARDDTLPSPQSQEDLFAYIRRIRGSFDPQLYRELVGAANEFKEGDAILGVAASNPSSREVARQLLARTTIGSLEDHPLFVDQLHRFARDAIDPTRADSWKPETLGSLKTWLLTASEEEIHRRKSGLGSDTIGCVVKLMSNHELTQVGAKIFNRLGDSHIGAKGYLGARIQPNSPTDHVDDIQWQVFNAFAFAVGDVLVGTNPVSSSPESVQRVELALQEILQAFHLEETLPHCVLSHIDVQAEVERSSPGSTALWFQSIAGNDAANQTFDISVDKMASYASQRTEKYGLYFETGQGADFTNGHGLGTDMVIHESRKYGFARRLSQLVAESTRHESSRHHPWVHVNDVAGFIGPEVFRTREQLVRCCLEDIVMGKLHGLTIGLDVCSTLHMDVSLRDLDWCLDQIAPANPAYLMALPTKIDPMLGYLTTGFQDHVRLREKFGLRVDDRMWKFFKSLEVIDEHGRPTSHFGDPNWVYLQFRRRLGDLRIDSDVLAEGEQKMREIRQRGVMLARGYHVDPWQMPHDLQNEIDHIYEDSKRCIWREWDPAHRDRIPGSPQWLKTKSVDRVDYILHPASGEHLSADSATHVERLSQTHSQYDAWIVLSDGLNATAMMEDGNLQPLLEILRRSCDDEKISLSPAPLVVNSGRVRAGYRIGEILFRGANKKKSILHVIGERPGSGHHTMSVYLTTAHGDDWEVPNRIDHNITKVVSGIAATAYSPIQAGAEVVALLKAALKANS